MRILLHKLACTYTLRLLHHQSLKQVLKACQSLNLASGKKAMHGWFFEIDNCNQKGFIATEHHFILFLTTRPYSQSGSTNQVRVNTKSTNNRNEYGLGGSINPSFFHWGTGTVISGFSPGPLMQEGCN